MRKLKYKIDHKTSYFEVVRILKKDSQRNFYELEDLTVAPDEYQTYILNHNVIVLITWLKNHNYDYLVRVVIDNYKNETIDYILGFLATKRIHKFIMSINCLDNVDIDFLQRKNLIFRNIRNSYVKMRQSGLYFNANIRELNISDALLAEETKFPEIEYRPSFAVLFNFFVRQNKGRILAYIYENRIIAYLSFIKSFDHYWDVDFIYVAEEFRNRGIGTALGKVYSQIILKEKMIPYWSNASIAASDKTALRAGF